MPNSLVICCDGTWNSADQADVNGEPCVTNVLKLACRVAKEAKDKSLQIVYYDQGVGTGNLADRVGGGAFGDGLEANINDAYRFLIANYEPGDRIYLFGFSRGAYTARSIGGMIRRCGILRRDAVKQYAAAKALYRSGVKADHQNAVDFRKANAVETDTPIQCIGVWDTVGALGIPLRAFGAFNQKKYQFLDTSLNSSVAFAYHALAVDEHRAPFLPTLWESAPAAGQVVRQVWFAGAHSDVGGGYPEHGLSDIALDWMMDTVEKEAGLEFDSDVRSTLGTMPDPTQAVHDSKSIAYTFSGADRVIGSTRFATEYFHRSLIQRWNDAKLKYRPKPLQPHEARLAALAASGPLTDEIYPVS